MGEGPVRGEGKWGKGDRGLVLIMDYLMKKKLPCHYLVGVIKGASRLFSGLGWGKNV